jgi:hypothetical protein
MYIWFDGIAGTGSWRGVRGDEVWLDDACACLVGVFDPSAPLLGELVCSVGNGGGKGEIDSDVTEADGCAL